MSSPTAEGIGVGLIGYGLAGRVFHAPLIRATPGLALRTIVAKMADAPAEYLRAEYPDVGVVPDVARMLADPAIALVVIATPNNTHAALAKQALRAGKAVVVEKPFALSLAEAREVLALAEAFGQPLTVFHNRRWDSDFLSIRAALEAGVIGRVVHFESHFDRFRPNVRQRWREDGEAGSGVWFDLGPHLVDQALLLFGPPLAVSADLAALRDGARANDWAHVVLRYADKRVVLHASLCVAGHVPRFIVHGTAGSLVKSGADQQETQLVAGLRPGDPEWGADPDPLRLRDATGHERAIPAPTGAQQQFYASLAAALAGLGPPPTLPHEVLAVQQVLEAAIIASREGRTVDLPQF